MPLFPQLPEWLPMNLWLGTVPSIIALLSVALAIIFYIKGKKVKLPCYAVRTVNIVRDLVSKFESLEMRYSGQPIRNLSVTKIAFWNAGRDTVDAQNIAPADPLRVRVKKGCKIFDAKIVYAKNLANQFSTTISDDQSYTTLQFDYVDKDEGVVIQLIHTGRSNDDIKVRGSIKGAGKPTYRYVPSSSTKRFRRVKAIGFFSVALMLIGLLLYLAGRPPTEQERVVFFRIMLPVSSLLIIGYSMLGFRVLKRRLPEGFDVFEEEF